MSRCLGASTHAQKQHGRLVQSRRQCCQRRQHCVGALTPFDPIIGRCDPRSGASSACANVAAGGYFDEASGRHGVARSPEPTGKGGGVGEPRQGRPRGDERPPEPRPPLAESAGKRQRGAEGKVLETAHEFDEGF